MVQQEHLVVGATGSVSKGRPLAVPRAGGLSTHGGRSAERSPVALGPLLGTTLARSALETVF
ncbi:hypothetical protein [Halorussus caseinilyticus]|uniref:Uncharacterized protein n=1 Tax=Halorussus caseinilyticus TaxID=3034025 RepID=A0ABD5WQQ1_9EURY